MDFFETEKQNKLRLQQLINELIKWFMNYTSLHQRKLKL